MMSFLPLLLDYYHREDKKGHLLFIMSFNKISGLIFLFLLCLISSLAYAEEPVTPTAATPITPTPPGLLTLEQFEVFDGPDDCTGNVALVWWKEISAENKSQSYVIFISKSAEGPFGEVCRFPSTEKWKKDKKWPFWASGAKDNYHYVEVNILKSFPPPDAEALDNKENALNEIIKQIETAKKDKTDYAGLRLKKKELIGEIKALKKKVSEQESEIKSQPYYFKVGLSEDKNITGLTGPASGQARNNWFNVSLLNNFLVMISFCGLVLWFISHAKKNQNLFLRRINGLDAVEEAVGRATEMGRSVFYLTGIGGMSEISTICATVILGKVAEKIAQYDTQIKVPHRDPIVMTVCQEIVKEAYTKSGRPDAYREDCNFYVTGDQFSYTAAVNGMMMREKPAANFFMGSYMAEALLLSEVGASTGAIQIAGSDSSAQLPFFITTCDYTLIGEEFYAASAYLSREPVLVGTLKSQDIGKMFMLAALIVGTIMITLKLPTILDLIKDFT